MAVAHEGLVHKKLGKTETDGPCEAAFTDGDKDGASNRGSTFRTLRFAGPRRRTEQKHNKSSGTKRSHRNQGYPGKAGKTGGHHNEVREGKLPGSSTSLPATFETATGVLTAQIEQVEDLGTRFAFWGRLLSTDLHGAFFTGICDADTGHGHLEFKKAA
jgi:hypothetical protein